MKKIYWIRRTIFILVIFALGALLSSEPPTWLVIGFPCVAMLLLMIYDEALFELREQKEPTPFSASVSSTKK